MKKPTIKQLSSEIENVEKALNELENIKKQLSDIANIAEALNTLKIYASDDLYDAKYWSSRNIDNIKSYLKSQKRKYANQIKRMQK